MVRFIELIFTELLSSALTISLGLMAFLIIIFFIVIVMELGFETLAVFTQLLVLFELASLGDEAHEGVGIIAIFQMEPRLFLWLSISWGWSFAVWSCLFILLSFLLLSLTQNLRLGQTWLYLAAGLTRLVSQRMAMVIFISELFWIISITYESLSSSSSSCRLFFSVGCLFIAILTLRITTVEATSEFSRSQGLG